MYFEVDPSVGRSADFLSKSTFGLDRPNKFRVSVLGGVSPPETVPTRNLFLNAVASDLNRAGGGSCQREAMLCTSRLLCLSLLHKANEGT